MSYPMIAIVCHRCGGKKWRKTGHTPIGQQQSHGTDGNFYGTRPTKEAQRAEKYRLVQTLHLERRSPRAIARLTGVSRHPMIKLLKKSLSTHGSDHCSSSGAAHFGVG